MNLNVFQARVSEVLIYTNDGWDLVLLSSRRITEGPLKRALLTS